ncbi:MAG: ATP phosphoribosyltransferase [Oscillospiraceae bacterium]|jgi:ATP phosphoribosyltransferase|nr:ATP phosphoribosyltransferase [Oscillospiraceae bacterium]
MINIALPKGRLGERVYGIFEAAGRGCPAVLEDSRKLFFEDEASRVRYFLAKPSDTHIYVERGAADIGVTGKDILLEYNPDVYELMDLGVGVCRVVVAAKKNFEDETDGALRVATKFANIARGYYDGRGREIDIIKLSGSIELAPMVGLSDVIVDIVETGRTLIDNGMEPMQTITDVSARLIANKVSYRFKHAEITALCEAIRRSMAK